MKRDIWREIKEYIKTHKKSSITWLAVCIITYAVLFWYLGILDGGQEIQEVPYTTFLQYMHDGKIDTIYYNKNMEYMTFTLLNDDTKNMPRKDRNEYEYRDADKRKTLYPAYDGFRKDVLEADTYIRFVKISETWSIVGNLLLPLVFFAGMFIVMSKVMTKGLSAKDVIQTSKVRFDDIIGHEEIIDDIKFITDLIQHPEKGEALGARVPKGILFSGPPGTGKTLLAKAIANEAGVPFLYQNASGFIEMFVGLGAKRVRDLFKIARKHAPCVIFIDEIDSVGGDRDSGKGTSENEQTINALIQEMDGFKARDGIFIIAATNRPEALDSALVRSGRFDRRININPPKDWRVRKKLFEHYMKDMPVSENINLDVCAKQVQGFTGADIAMICNEASIVALMKNKQIIDSDCMEEAIDKKLFDGNRVTSGVYEEDREIVAYHEAGHAVMNFLLDEPIARASIQSTTSGVGGVVIGEDRESMFMTDKMLKNNILIAYAGRVSEEIKFKTVTTGASNDITQATKIMTQYIEHFGFDQDFGMLDVSVLTKEHLVNSTLVTDRLKDMSIAMHEECRKLLSENYDKVEIVAQALLRKETLSGHEIKDLLKS